MNRRPTMQAKCSSDLFRQAINAVQSVTEVRISNPVVENIVLRAEESMIRVYATDLSLDVEYRIEAEVEKPGDIAVPARLAQGIVRELYAPDLAITGEGSSAMFRCGRNEFEIQVVDTEEFPVFEPVQDGRGFDLGADVLRSVLRRTVFATTSEQGAFQLDGVRVSGQEGALDFVATDGRRLSKVTLQEAGADGLIALIPAKAMQELGRLLPEEGTISVMAGEKKAMFSGDRFVLVTRLLEDEFPPYQHIIPGEFSFSVEVEREPFAQCVRAATVMSRGTVQMVRISLTKGSMEISSEEGEVGRARGEIPVDYQGEEFRIGFRGSFLIDFLRCGEGDMIRMDIVDAARASVFRNVGEEEFLHLIMPMRLEDRPSGADQGAEEEDEAAE